MKRVDYIIVGAGVAGASLGMRLRMRGQRVMVFNNDAGASASKAAAGIFNPITGKSLLKTWMAEEIFTELHIFYEALEKATTTHLIQTLPIYIPFRSIEEQNNWTVKSTSGEFKGFIQQIHTRPAVGNVNDPLGGMMLSRTGNLFVNRYLDVVKRIFQEDGRYENTIFDESALHSSPTVISYKEWEAKGIIFCQGVENNVGHPFRWLPVRALYGETLEVEIAHEYPCIVNRGVYAVPVHSNTYRIGATYRHGGENGPTAEGKSELTEKLAGLITCPFRVIGQGCGSRPTSPDRRPILGRHPAHENLWIFNGLGTKGISLAPYFSKTLADAILGDGEVPAEVNISRFYPLYSKSRD
jgi:glycine/D-amino acid oxidase-like deaminating enzyme